MHPNAFDLDVPPAQLQATYLEVSRTIDQLSTAYNELVTKATAALDNYRQRTTSVNHQNQVARTLYCAAANIAHSLTVISDRAGLLGVATCWEGTVEWLHGEIKRCN